MPSPAKARPWRADLRRSVFLLGEFRVEQTDPRRFYTALATDSAEQLSQYVDLDGARMLDVGGGPGYFREAFEAKGASYVALDSDVGELAGAGTPHPGTVIGSGMQLPFKDDALDVCYSSNVLEHVIDPWLMAEEMVRVTRPGGLVFISYTTWFGPWGGHETSPWHYAGGDRARRRYERTNGHAPKNVFGTSLFKVTVRDGLRWASDQTSCDVVATIPRYNPWWSRFLLRVPLLREVVTWNLVLVLRKR